MEMTYGKPRHDGLLKNSVTNHVIAQSLLAVATDNLAESKHTENWPARSRES